MKQTTRSLKNEITRFKMDQFTLNQESPSRWKVSGRDSEGKYRRFRFDAIDLSEAVKLAEEHLRNPPTGTTKAVVKQEPKEHLHISDAMIRATETRNWTDYTRQRDSINCEYFLNWVDSEGLTYWHELRYEHVLKYHKSLIDRGLVFDTIRHSHPIGGSQKVGSGVVFSIPKNAVISRQGETYAPPTDSQQLCHTSANMPANSAVPGFKTRS